MERRTFLRASALSAGGLGTLAAGSPGALAAGSPGTLRIQVLMFDGVEEQDFVAPVEVFGLARFLGGNLTTTLVTTNRPGTVTGAYGTRVQVSHGWSPQDADVLVVPGGGYIDPSYPGVYQVNNDKDFLRRLAAAEAMPVGICAGTMILSAAGITRGRNATTHASAKQDLADQGATVINARVVDDGDLITGGGVTSGLDVSLWLVERFLGAKLAQAVETVLEYERRGTVWRA